MDNEDGKLDLDNIPNPPSLRVVIDGKGEFIADLPAMSLVAAIAHVYVILTGKSVDICKFSPKVTVLEHDLNGPYPRIKVAISD